MRGFRRVAMACRTNRPVHFLAILRVRLSNIKNVWIEKFFASAHFTGGSSRNTTHKEEEDDEEDEGVQMLKNK
jgi:hypothetical protein